MNPLIRTPAYVDRPMPALRGQAFIVTGAAGSIGSEVCRRLCSEGAHVTGVDIDENGLTYLADDIGGAFVPFVSDITKWTIQGTFIGAGTYIHCAARKHVAFGETHKAEYVNTNIGGTLRVIQAANASGSRFVLVSTDKAVNAVCVMGRTKRYAELKTLAFGHSVVRLVNVYGSRGSVVPRWRRQVESGQPCTVTDWNHRRFYMTPSHAAHTIIEAALNPVSATIVVPRDFAELTTRELFEAEFRDERPNVTVIGARPGERDHEELWHSFEAGDGSHGVPDIERHLKGDELALMGFER